MDEEIEEGMAGAASPPRSGFQRALARLAAAWDWTRDLGKILRPCRFSLILALVGGLAITAVPQGRDLLRQLGEWPAWGIPLHLVLFFFASLLFWSFNSWYFARVMLTLRFEDTPPPSRRRQLLSSWVPRVLGALPLWSAGIGLLAVFFTYPEAITRLRLLLFGLVCLGLGTASLFVFPFLRRYVPRLPPLRRGRRESPESAAAAAAPRAAAFKTAEYGALAEVPRPLVHMTILSLALASLLFLAFVFFPVRLAPLLGSAAILFLAAATWVPFGSGLIYLGLRFRVPVITLLFLAVLAFSFLNDNHGLRRVRLTRPAPCGAASPALDPRAADPRCPFQSLETHLLGWVTRRLDAEPERDSQPLVLVTAEGGGARAAYWTASVLAAVQDEEPSFAGRVYGISGVSGGSLGAAAFAALLAEAGGRGALPCRPGDGTAEGPLAPCARSFLSRDFLSPPLAAMLYQDLVQRFIPWPIPPFDRARALERAWEKSWRDTVPGSNRFAEPFSNLWAGAAGNPVPNLLLNGTWVETGQRVLTSNLRFDRSPFPDSVDFYAPGAPSPPLTHDLPLSTAVHNSARFTFLSPAGRIDGAGGRTAGHLVDGGYFENSGAATALDIAVAFARLKRQWAYSDTRWRGVRPVVVAITNSPASGNGGLPPAAQGMVETRAPIETLLKTRQARGNQALAALEAFVEAEGGTFLPFSVCRYGEDGEKLPVPLGWFLSKAARDALDDQLTASCGEHSNASSMEELRRVLSAVQPGRR